ncbi:ATP synthase subunit I [Thiolapillus sp.]|uniref:ATP synthase subunit I n=3 Tax=Thiolapillus sp. TaxID=2017437 RepID=UPI0025CBF2D7|nr:ATP synthase subunit I [Thiolapillus sp.]
MMGKPMDWQRVKRLLFVQAGLVTAATLAGMAVGKTAALSAFLGGVIALGASAIFAFWVFAPYRAQQPGILVTRFYIAEVGKLVFVACAFAVIFIWLRPLNAVALFVSFFLVQVVSPVLAHWLTGKAQR